jgi:hypothetical protein
MNSQVHQYYYRLLSPFHDNFPFISGNIPSAPAYGVIIFQLIHYLTACRSYLYTDFLYFAKFLIKKHSEHGKLCCLTGGAKKMGALDYSYMNTTYCKYISCILYFYVSTWIVKIGKTFMNLKLYFNFNWYIIWQLAGVTCTRTFCILLNFL